MKDGPPKRGKTNELSATFIGGVPDSGKKKRGAKKKNEPPPFGSSKIRKIGRAYTVKRQQTNAVLSAKHHKKVAGD